MWLLAILASFLAILIAPSIIYYRWMKRNAKKNWTLSIDNNYRPRVSLIIATYNEASDIINKLENVQKTCYPEDKLQIILVDSASNDGTLSLCKDFLQKTKLRFPVRLVTERERLGKSHALNTALQFASGKIIATSDADSFWEPDALSKAVAFFADPSVGAITGREELTNLGKSVHTLSEGLYRSYYYTLRLGESKVSSTLIFQGELSLYRRSAFQKFEDRAGYSDDIGTVIDLIARGYRCIFVPQAVFHDTAASSFNGRLMLKSRRAQHLIAGIMKSANLKVRGQFPLSSAIVCFNFYMHIVSPLLIVSIAVLGVATFVLYFQFLWPVVPLTALLLTFKKPRLFMTSYLTSNIALIAGLIQNLRGRKETTWRKIDDM